jgi:hypothetical protein
MLWLRRDGEFVASTSRGQYVVYRAAGRTFAAMFRPAGTHARTRDIGLGASIGEAKSIAERHAMSAMGVAAAYSRTRATRASTRTRSNFVPQSILFDARLYSELDARRWIRQHQKHGYRALKVTTEHGKVRVRQLDPREIIPGTWATVKFGKGITAVFGRVRPAATRALRRAA